VVTGRGGAGRGTGEPAVAGSSDSDASSPAVRRTTRDCLEFSTGRDPTSEDVKFSTDRLWKINFAARLSLYGAKPVIAPGDKTVVFRRKPPGAAFPAERGEPVTGLSALRQPECTVLRRGRLRQTIAQDVPVPLCRGKQRFASRSGGTGVERALNSSTTTRFWELGRGVTG
jgi:hypothetical protein